MNKEGNKVYLVIEYKEKYTNKLKSIFVKGENQEAIDNSTKTFETKEQLANLYYKWIGAHTEGAIKSLKDMYIVSEESNLGSYLTEALEEERILQKLTVCATGHITVDEKYLLAKKTSLKESVKLMKDRKSVLDQKSAFCVDRTPIIQMPIRTRRK